eukprot:12432972-Alexandrium_andersonii.AAC.1
MALLVPVPRYPVVLLPVPGEGLPPAGRPARRPRAAGRGRAAVPLDAGAQWEADCSGPWCRAS